MSDLKALFFVRIGLLPFLFPFSVFVFVVSVFSVFGCGLMGGRTMMGRVRPVWLDPNSYVNWYFDRVIKMDLFNNFVLINLDYFLNHN